MPIWSESTRGYGLLCSGCCNPYQKKQLRGGRTTGEDGKSLLVYTHEGNAQRMDCIISSLPPFMIFAPITWPFILFQISASRLMISLNVAANGVTEVIGEVRTKTCCGEEEEKFSGIRGAEMDKTLWTTLPNQQGRSPTGMITCHLELLLPFGKKTIDCDQAGGERACREINEFIHTFAPHVTAPPSQQMMLVPGSQPMPMGAVQQELTNGSTVTPPAYVQQRM